MNFADAPLYFLAALTYHPEIATFNPGRGAWRVHHCVEWFWPIAPRMVRVQDDDDEPHVLMLHIQSPRPLKPGTYINPTKLLREVFEQRRQAALFAVAERVFAGPQPEHQFA